MGLEDDFLKDDLDDEKTIEYIKNYLPPSAKIGRASCRERV